MPHFIGLNIAEAAELFFKGFLILGIAFLISRFLLRTSASLRHTIWFLALTALILIPYTSYILPEISMPIPDISELIKIDSGGEKPQDNADTDSYALGYSDGAGKILLLLEFIYLSGIAVTAVWVFWGWLSVFLRCQRAVPVKDKNIHSIFQALKKECRIHKEISLLSNPLIRMPMTFGLFRPSIYLPKNASSWPSERLRLVFLHELAHIKRKDNAVRLIGTIACALHWFNPLAWFALRNMLREQEFACDGYAVRKGIKPSQFAPGLLALAGTERQNLEHVFAGLVRRDDLKLRLYELLQPLRKNLPLKPPQIIFIGMCTVLLIIGLSAVSLYSPDASASRSDLLTRAEYFFNGPIEERHQKVLDRQNAGDYFDGIQELLISENEFTKAEFEAHLEKLRTYIDWKNMSNQDEIHQTARNKMSLVMEKYEQTWEKYLLFRDKISLKKNGPG
ncbi:MAG: M56 family metallopeptidase [Candidatus Aminicenantes bacterium]|nr:MAG: M56 family metallopeptidase [Candidatus Aminicenantes bacterium]